MILFLAGQARPTKPYWRGKPALRNLFGGASPPYKTLLAGQARPTKPYWRGKPALRNLIGGASPPYKTLLAGQARHFFQIAPLMLEF
jgi:hypothetical protein